MLAQIHRLLDRYRGLPADSLLEQPVMFALFMGIVLANLVLFLLVSQPFAFENALWLALASVCLTGVAHVLFKWTLQRTTHLLIAQTYALLLYSIWVTGGLFSSSTMWMMILPVPGTVDMGDSETVMVTDVAPRALLLRVMAGEFSPRSPM